MRRYLYDMHLGGLYVSDEIIEDTYCETCGDSDFLIGSFETIEELWGMIVISGNWSLQHVYPFILETFGLPDDSKYENSYYRDQGFCCDSDDEIRKKIKNLIESEKRSAKND